MKYLGADIFSKPPEACNIHTADCPFHGFSVKKKRSQQIWDALYDHGDACQDKDAGTVDYARFMAGPDLDLQTLSELLLAGYFLNQVMAMLQEWEGRPEQLTRQVSTELQRLFKDRLDRDGGSIAANFGQTGPAID